MLQYLFILSSPHPPRFIKILAISTIPQSLKSKVTFDSKCDKNDEYCSSFHLEVKGFDLGSLLSFFIHYS